jgi:macrolide transport system ATP-binding/permease protein
MLGPTSSASSAPSSFQVVLDDVVRSPGGRPLLDGVRQTVALGERIGVVGENGGGKSTLLRLIAGLDRPDAGELRVHAPGGTGYLPQTPDLPPDDTVQDAVDHALAEIRALERALRTTEQALAEAAPAELDGLLASYGELLAAFEARDGYAADARVQAALHGLGIAHLAPDRLLGSLSGGEQARLGLACVLAAAPQLLLLDEPTNHLDITAVEWLEKHLCSHRGSVLVVSHDRVFLERVATALWEVDPERRTVHRHGGGYPGYLRARAAIRRRWEREYADWERELAEQRELVRRAADGVASGARRAANADRVGGRHQRSVERQLSSRVRQAKERVRRLEESPVPRPPEPLRFTARVAGGDGDGAGDGHAAGSGSGGNDGAGHDEPLAALHDVAVAPRLDIPEFTVAPGERVLVTGPNGAGKSTLLRVLAGDLRPDRGRCRRPARIGWLPQESRVTDPGRTLLDAFAAGRPGDPEEHRAALLGFGLFRPADLAVRVGALSTGQLRRLALARLLCAPVDLLLLDEPTNHFSPALVEDVEAALDAYRGALVMVTHDRMLSERFTGRRVRLRDGRQVP